VPQALPQDLEDLEAKRQMDEDAYLDGKAQKLESILRMEEEVARRPPSVTSFVEDDL
jgi:hypothetical protein